MYKSSSLTRLVIAASMLIAALPAMVGAMTLGSTVAIKSVDNYGGNRNVYTDKPNTTIKVIELDTDRKPVRSWTGATDSDGKLAIPAGHSLSKPNLRAETAEPKMAEFVTPTSVESGEPFTFAATGSVSGTVVSVQTVEGEVVATQKPDRYGRVFLAAGLAAGSYVLSSTNGANTGLGKIEVQPSAGAYSTSALLEPHKLEMLGTDNPARNLSETVRIGVRGGRADASQLTAACVQDGGDDKVALPVLAATSDEVVLGKPADHGVRPGPVCFEVHNEATGRTTRSQPTMAYSATGKLTQVTVPSGLETRLLVTVLPSTLSGSVNARVQSGPVTMANGAKEMSVPLSNGVAEFRILSQPGTMGTFNVGWSLDAPWLFNGTPAGEKKPGPGKTVALEDDGWVKFIEDDPTKAGKGRTGKKRVVSNKDGVMAEEIRWDDDGSYANKTTTKTEEGKTVATSTTTPGTGGVDTIVEETIGYDAEGYQVSGIRKTWKHRKGGEKTLHSTETWKKKGGWS